MLFGKMSTLFENPKANFAILGYRVCSLVQPIKS